MVQGDGWALAAPRGWRSFEGITPPVVCYLTGDAKPGIPPFDGTLSVLKAGLMVERFDAAAVPLQARIDRDVWEVTTSPAFEPFDPPAVEQVALADGTPATVLTVQFVRKQNGRVSFQTKLYAAGDDGRHTVVTTFVTCSRPGRRSVEATGLPALLKASALTLVLDPAALDLQAISKRYGQHDGSMANAVAATVRGNRLIAQEQWPAAQRVLREAIAGFATLPAAHNALAWALLHDPDADADALAEALREAKLAVEQTERLDPSALDTLALAHARNGNRPAALAAAEEALALRPDDPALRARADSLREDEEALN